MGLSNVPNPRRLEVVKVLDDSEHVFAKLELARLRASTAAPARWTYHISFLQKMQIESLSQFSFPFDFLFLLR